MTREEYVALPGLNFSKAKYLLKSAAHFRAAVDEEKEPTEAQQVGSMAHQFVLENIDARSLYAVKPEGMSFATTAGKEWKAAQTLPILTQEQYDMIPGMADSIAKNRDASAFLRGCPMREHVVTATLRGVPCKALVDFAGESGGEWAFGDLKTAVDASPVSFSKAIFNGQYDMQAAWYSQLMAMAYGLESPPYFVWIAVEKTKPFVVQIYQPSEEVIASGNRKLETVLELYKQCMETGEWPGYGSGIQEIQLPSWARKEIA